MDFVSKIIGLAVGLTVGVTLVANLILPVIQGLSLTGDNAETYTTMFGVVGLLAIVSLVVYAASAIRGRN